jgi:hypothetical protein
MFIVAAMAILYSVRASHLQETATGTVRVIGTEHYSRSTETFPLTVDQVKSGGEDILYVEFDGFMPNRYYFDTTSSEVANIKPGDTITVNRQYVGYMSWKATLANQ